MVNKKWVWKGVATALVTGTIIAGEWMIARGELVTEVIEGYFCTEKEARTTGFTKSCDPRNQ